MDTSGNNLSKQKIFLDADDVLLNSSEVAVDIINKRFNVNPPKTIYDIKDWGFKAIYKGMTKDIINEIFASQEFWNKVKIQEGFLNLLKDEEILNGYHWCIVTKGCTKNLDTKYTFFAEHSELSKYIDDIEFYGLEDYENKSVINMSDGIQVDDNMDNLHTNASLKILMLNYLNTEYNNLDTMRNEENTYRINTFEELGQILKFNLIEKLY